MDSLIWFAYDVSVIPCPIMSNLDGSKWNRWPTYQSKGKPRTYLKSYAHPSSLVHHPVLLTVTEPVEHPMASVCTQCLLAKGGNHFLLSWWVSDEASWDSSGSTKSQARITHNNQIHPNPWYGFCTQTWSFWGSKRSGIYPDHLGWGFDLFP